MASAGFIAYLVGMGWLMVQNFARNMTRVELLADAVQAAHHRLERTHRSVLRFVPVEFLDFLGKNSIEEVQRGDRTDLVLTVQFSDVRSFTTITEKLSPGETFDLVGDYLERVCKPVSAHNGFVDKYIGDAVMALFLSADEAMKSCLEQLSALDATNEQRVEKGEISFEVGFGLHTGPVTLGTVGSTERIDCTVLGDSVNLASRIESLTVRYGTRLLVSSSVVDALSSPGDYELREVDRVVVKGKTEPVRLFEVIDVDASGTLSAAELMEAHGASGVAPLLEGVGVGQQQEVSMEQWLQFLVELKV